MKNTMGFIMAALEAVASAFYFILLSMAFKKVSVILTTQGPGP